MKFPNKITRIDESIMPYLLKILKIISLHPINVTTLYKELKIMMLHYLPMH